MSNWIPPRDRVRTAVQRRKRSYVFFCFMIALAFSFWLPSLSAQEPWVAPLVSNPKTDSLPMSMASTFRDWRHAKAQEVEDLSLEATAAPEYVAWLYGILSFAALVVLASSSLSGGATTSQAGPAWRSPSPKRRAP